MRTETLEPRFVEAVPTTIEPGLLYVSMEFATTSHLCCCGCGNRVVLPLHPTAWQLRYDGKGISISPSVGNWSFPCRSHYWIKSNQIDWAGEWSDERVQAGRERALAEREAATSMAAERPKAEAALSAPGLLRRLARKLFPWVD